jgi:hypothetical protein
LANYPCSNVYEGVPPGTIDWVLVGSGIGVVAVVVVGGLLIAKKRGM